MRPQTASDAAADSQAQVLMCRAMMEQRCLLGQPVYILSGSF